ncbi:MAG TPA: HD domain-containing protein [Armatimonadota bacterium]|nr:HD domain-containing protein [Armatimonadota bacterium]
MVKLDENIRRRLRSILNNYAATASACHQVDHTFRVVTMALTLAEHYPDVDCAALEAAAWLHDIGRGVERSSHISHAIISAELAEEMLPEFGFDSVQTKLICTAIADHRYSAKRQPTSLIGCLLQDADRLDALGAIGIARTFSESTNRMLFHPQSPFGDGRQFDDAQYALDHFFLKLLKLPATLHTPEAREIAQQRVAFLQTFLRELAHELGTTYSHAE